jgi:hypothetical protein
LHNSAAASVFVLTGVEGRFLPSIEYYYCPVLTKRFERTLIEAVVWVEILSVSRMTVKIVLRLN